MLLIALDSPSSAGYSNTSFSWKNTSKSFPPPSNILSLSTCCIGVLLPIGTIWKETSLDPRPETVGSKTSRLQLSCRRSNVSEENKSGRKDSTQNSEVHLKPRSPYTGWKTGEVGMWLCPFARKENVVCIWTWCTCNKGEVMPSATEKITRKVILEKPAALAQTYNLTPPSLRAASTYYGILYLHVEHF